MAWRQSQDGYNRKKEVKFRKRRNDIVPQSILDADNLRGKDPSVSQTEALAFAGKGSLNEMKIEDWIAYMHRYSRT